MKEFNNNWQVKSLGEICKITTGDKDVNEGDVNGEYPFFTCAAEPLRSASYSFDGESILLPGNGANVGLALYYNGKFEAYQRTYVLNNFSADVKYVFFHLKDRWKKSQENKQFGSATNYIRYDNIASYKIPLPPLPIQKQIAEILEQADLAKQKRKEANKLTDEFLQSVFIEMFGDPILNNKRWNKKKMGHSTNFITDGKHGDCRNDVDSGYYFLSAKNINGFKIDYSNARQILREDFEEVHRRTDLQPGDLLLVNTGATIGKVAVVPEDYRVRKTTLQKSVAVIKPDLSQMNVEYLKYSFLISLREMVKSSSGSAQKNLLLSEIRKIELAIPPIDLQNIFAEIVNKTEALKEKQKQSERELENLFQSLMQNAFKGELV